MKIEENSWKREELNASLFLHQKRNYEATCLDASKTEY